MTTESLRSLAQLALFGVGTVSRGADLSPCNLYRFRLWRTWDESKPAALFCGLNPSTADATQDDPTIRRCIRFAQDWGWGGLVMVNLFAFRSTDPDALWQSKWPNPIEEENLEHVRRAVAEAGVCVAAWGAHGLGMRRFWSLHVVGIQPDWRCLGTTKDGGPRHPLYIPATTPLQPWRPA